MLDRRLLDALVAVVELGSFDKAAERLRVTQSAVSQRIKELENRVGRPLVLRSEGQATDVGERLVRYARQLQALEQEALSALDIAGAPWRRLSVAVNADSLATWFPDALGPVLAAGDRVVDIVADDHTRTIDHLRSGAVLACVSSRLEAVQGCSVRPLGRMRYVCVASAAAVDRIGSRRLDRELAARLPVIQSGEDDEIVEQFVRRVLGLDRFQYPYHVVPSSIELLTFALAGHGYSVLPFLQVEEHLARGDLVDIAPGLYYDVSLHWHRWKTSTELLDEFTRSVEAAARRHLAPY